MKLITFITIVLFCAVAAAQAQSDSAFTNITVLMPDDDPIRFGGEMILLPRGEYTFRAHAPADTSRRYPCIFVLEDEGGGVAEELAGVVGDYWVVVQVPVRPGQPMGKAVARFLCAHDKLVYSLPVHPGLKFVAGAGENAARGIGLAGMRSGFYGALCTEPDGQLDGRVFGVNKDFLVYCRGADTNAAQAFMAQLPDGSRSTASPGAAAKDALDWMEEQILIECPYKTSLRAYYLRSFSRLAREAATAEGEEKEALLDRVARLASRRELYFDPFVRKRLERLGLGPKPENP